MGKYTYKVMHVGYAEGPEVDLWAKGARYLKNEQQLYRHHVVFQGDERPEWLKSFFYHYSTEQLPLGSEMLVEASWLQVL